MALETHPDSHLDHDLSPEHVRWILERFSDREGFFVETITLPDALDPVDCGLYGPVMGDEPVPETEVSYVVRTARKCASRLVYRPTRETRQLTVIAGPHDGRPCVLFTAFGGPAAPREPGDTTIDKWDAIEESRSFWALHALANTVKSVRE